jgi:hypothetical protein
VATVLDPFRVPMLTAAPADAAEPPVPSQVTVTPEMAKDWTSRNDRNRPVRYAFVAQLARDMRAGNWDLNGETIKIAANGSLLDGQHRLYACILAEVPFETFVVTGLPAAAQRTMDTGTKRKVSDQLSLAGEENSRALAPVARWGLLWLRGARSKSGRDIEPTHQEILAFIAAEPRLREAAAFALRARKDVAQVRVSVWGMAWLLFTGINDIAATVFLDRVRDGADIGVGHPAHTLRARVFKQKDERLKEHEQLALFCVAWNAFREDRKITKLPLPTGGTDHEELPGAEVRVPAAGPGLARP